MSAGRSSLQSCDFFNICDIRRARDLIAFMANRVPVAVAKVLTEHVEEGLESQVAADSKETKAALQRSPAMLNDAAASLRYALETAVFDGAANESLSHARFVALRGVLAALTVALPALELPERLLPRLAPTKADINMDGSGSGDGHGTPQPMITRRDWEELLQHERAQSTWSPACDPDGKGLDSGAYTCGLWLLFHSLVAESHPKPSLGLAPDAASAAIRAFVDNFFGCAYCRDHFLHMYDACEYGRCDDPQRLFRGANEADRLVLWLWRAHNAVNARVKGNVKNLQPGKKAPYDVDDASAPWAFPPAAACSACRDPKNRWVEKEVLAYLRHTYAPSQGTRTSNVGANTGLRTISEVNVAYERKSFFRTVLFVTVIAAFLFFCCGHSRANVRQFGLTSRRSRSSAPGFASSSSPWSSSSKKQRVLADAL